jgi:tetratricopeptide (TPR) repeat protein
VKAALLLIAALASDAQLFQQAEDEYAHQRYDMAIGKYEELLARGAGHENVFYNLGNAYFRNGNIGKAIVNYERAVRLAPDSEDARFNLEVARETAATKWGKDTLAGAEQDPLWVRVVHWLPLRTLAWVFLALDVAFFGILLAMRFLSTGFLRTGLGVGNVFIGLAGVVLGVLLAGQLYHRTFIRAGVVTANEVVTRDGPDETRREMFKLHAGHRLVLLKESRGWVRVRLANRVEVWAPKQAVEEI